MPLDEYLFPAGRPTWAEGYIAAKPIEDEGDPTAQLWLTVVPLTFGRARLCVATAGNASVEHWCMSSPGYALLCWLLWPREVVGWNRHQRRDGVLEWPDGRTDE